MSAENSSGRKRGRKCPIVRPLTSDTPTAGRSVCRGSRAQLMEEEMDRLALGVLLLVALTAQAGSEVIRKECQTEESRGLRLVAEAMSRAARESDPWAGCPGGGCTMSSSVADSMRATQRRFEAEAIASLLKARAAEAARCPHWERAIMDNIPATDEERSNVAAEFGRLITKRYERLAAFKKWQTDHPQCKHVTWFISGGICPDGDCSRTKTPYSVEDLSGNFEGKPGHCSIDGRGEAFRGTEEDMKPSDPATNPAIAEAECAAALRKFGFGDRWRVDPASCK